jgi:DNA-binding GntR family transcriptional regulator
MPASPLAQRIAKEIMSSIQSGRIPAGSHLSAQQLADEFDVSRSPVREALQMLAENGALEQKRNRGFFVRALDLGEAPANGAGESMPFDEPNDYQRIADDWIANRMPAEVTEMYLRDTYGLTKAQLADILMRAVREGWAERKQGYGWRLLPVAKTPEAFEQIYRFRMLIEPAAMLEPTYKPDPAVLARHRQIQEKMLASDIETMPGEKLLELGSLFHEDLIAFSRNPFFHQALVRVNRMRRLMEYRSNVDRRRLYDQCTQHLELIGLLEKGEIFEASYLMRRHLGGALATKSPVVIEGADAKREKQSA